MVELHNWHESADEVEAILLAAGGYVRPTDDLRPRVLEAARLQRRERRARQWIRGLAAAVVLTAGGAALVDPLVSSEGERGLAWRGVTSQTLYADAEARSIASGGLNWGIVDAFRDLREEQREALRPER
jgi:hypothetical protein